MEIFETDYSDKEIELFTFFGIADLVNCSMPVCLYRMCVEKAFVNELSGPYVDSLRRCYKALTERTCFRGTPEWDNLIQLKITDDDDYWYEVEREAKNERLEREGLPLRKG